MPIDIIVDSPDQFETTIQDQLSNNPGALVYVYVTGKKDATTQKSWCPDCVVSEPIIYEDFIPEVEREASKKGVKVIVIKALVERSEYRGNPNYPYRTHADLRVKGIPTFILWNAKDEQKGRIDNFEDLDLLDALRVLSVNIVKK